MEATLQALQQAGYTVETTEPYGTDTALTVVKDGLRQRFAVSPSIGVAGVAEMMKWIEQKHEQQAK